MITSENCIAVKFQDDLKTNSVQFIQLHITEKCYINKLGTPSNLIDLIAQKKCSKQTVAAFPKERYATREIDAVSLFANAGALEALLRSKVEND